MRKTILSILLLSIMAMLCACQQSNDDYASAGDSAGAPVMRTAGAQSAGGDQLAGHLLIWRANISIQVNDVNITADALGKKVAEMGGYIQDKKDWTSQTTLVLRIPKEQFNAGIAEVEGSGTITSRQVSGEDVTEQYMDVETRLKNNKALCERLRALLGKAVDVKDIIQIETELNRVQSEVDSMEARMRVLKGQIELSTITVQISKMPAPVPPTIYGPIGYLYVGAKWVITKLYIIRE